MHDKFNFFIERSCQYTSRFQTIHNYFFSGDQKHHIYATIMLKIDVKASRGSQPNC